MAGLDKVHLRFVKQTRIGGDGGVVVGSGEDFNQEEDQGKAEGEARAEKKKGCWERQQLPTKEKENQASLTCQAVRPKTH